MTFLQLTVGFSAENEDVPTKLNELLMSESVKSIYGSPLDDIIIFSETDEPVINLASTKAQDLIASAIEKEENYIELTKMEIAIIRLVDLHEED
jgi:hypothetical protein